MSVLSVANSRSLPLVLIVDDNADTRQMYAEFFLGQYDVLQAGDGAKALEVMRTRRPDILITDLSMPGIDGFELIAQVRKDPDLSRVPIICLSGYGGPAHERRARDAGCDRMLLKPCMPDDLAAVMEELLTARRSGGG